MVEGTLAGIAAGAIASIDVLPEGVIDQAPCLEVWKDGERVDIALVDVVVSKAEFVASRAVWDESTLDEVFLTRAEPENIGFSSLGGYLCHVPADSGMALYIAVGPGGQRVRAPIAPGLVRWVPIESYRTFNSDETIPIRRSPGVIALDGEREITIGKDDRYSVRFSPNGPKVVNLTETLKHASQECVFIDE